MLKAIYHLVSDAAYFRFYEIVAKEKLDARKELAKMIDRFIAEHTGEKKIPHAKGDGAVYGK